MVIKNLEAIIMNNIERNAVYSDIHFPEHNRHAVECATQMVEDYKPHRIILIGDALNMTPVSHWMEDKKRPLENRRLLKEYTAFNELLDNITKRAGPQLKEVVYILGNHERFVQDYLDKYPAAEGLLEVENNVKLSNKKLKLTFVPLNGFYKLGKLWLTHGLYTTKYHAAKMVENVGRSVMYGHTHTVQQYTQTGMVSDEKHQGISIGCLCDMAPEYMQGRPHSWIHAMAFVDVRKNGNFTPHVVNIINGEAVFNGKLYKA